MEQELQKDNRSSVRLLAIVGGLVLLILSLVLAIVTGAVHISVSDVYQSIVAPGSTDNYRII